MLFFVYCVQNVRFKRFVFTAKSPAIGDCRGRFLYRLNASFFFTRKMSLTTIFIAHFYRNYDTLLAWNEEANK